MNYEKIVVTGATGFIGRHVCSLLAQRGFDVVPLARSAGDAMQTWCLEATVEYSAHRLKGASAIVHLAAYLPDDYEDLDQAVPCFRTNSVGTLNLLQAAELAGIRHFVHASTCALYTPSASPVNEGSPTIPQRAMAYLASKLAAEVYVAGFSFGRPLATTTLRLASVYGPGMPNAGLVPACVRYLKSTGRFTVADANRYRTDLVHVLDVAEAIYASLIRATPGTFNIASGHCVSPLDVAKTAAQLLGISADGIEIASASKMPVPNYNAIDIGKARNALGIRPRLLGEGLMNYIDSIR